MNVCRVLANIFGFCGTSVQTEQTIPHAPSTDPDLRPADLLLSQSGHKVAIDVSVVSPPCPVQTSALEDLAGPSRANARLGHMDAAVSRKIIKYRGICEKAGWTFESFVCDTYCAMTQNARTTLSLAVKKLKPEDRYYESTSGYAAVWRGVSAAIVSRAAEQYLRAMEHYLVETPAADYSDLCNSGSNTLSSTGIYHMYQPSLSEPMLTDDVESGDMPPSSVAPASANTGLTSAPQHPTAPVSSGQRPPRMMQLPSGEVRDLPRPAQIAGLLPPDQVATHIAGTGTARTCSNTEFGLRDVPLDTWCLEEHDRYQAPTCTRGTGAAREHT